MPADACFKVISLATSFLVASLLSLPTLARAQQPVFPLPVLSPLNAGPNPATGDFNGDGQSDAAFISNASEITVLLNQGPSNPVISKITNGLNCTLQTILAGDVNKDTKLDVVVTCSEGFVGVLFGNGDGTFQTPSYYSVSALNGSAALGDLNGDGYLDIAVTSSDRISNPAVPKSAAVVLLNNGTLSPGTFASPKSYALPVSQTGTSTILGDFNGDGKQDVLAGQPGYVFYGNGDGTLQAAVSTSATSVYVAADLNNDGITDIAYYVADPGTGSITSLQILLGAANGTFVTGYNQPISPYESYQAIVPFRNTTTGTITNLALVGSNTLILTGDGSGKFTSGATYGIGFPSQTGGNGVSTQIGTNGNSNLVFYVHSLNQTVAAVGNGDGTFQAPPTTFIPYASGNAGIPVTADINGDGLTDVLGVDFGGNLIAAIGRGNGRFAITTQNTGGTQPQVSQSPLVVSGDFDGDGKTDALVIYYGAVDSGDTRIVNNIQLFFYGGNGDGTFKPSLAPFVLSVYGASSPLVGDFNGDGKLDLVLSYGGFLRSGLPPAGAVFIAGKGDGTFATEVSLALSNPAAANPGIVADVNKDGKLDIVGQGTVNLGNGDGTFNSQPLGITGTPLVIGDLNGDGKSDLVVKGAIYAGNGDGTFQTTPFFNNSSVVPSSASIGDVNGDGNVDLVLFSQNPSGVSSFSPYVFFGDGKGNFTADSNTYYIAPGNVDFGTLGRLNNQASLSGNVKQDFVSLSSTSVTSYLNQNNPAPATPAPLPSKTTLVASATTVTPGQQVTFTAKVTGLSPTGAVSFQSGTTTLGTGTVANGTATLTTSFTTTGTYIVTASYAGDPNNTASSSTPVSETVALATSKTTLAVSAGNAGTNQQLTFSASVTGLNPTGKVTFTSAGTTLGTANLTSGAAVLPFTFAAAGTYSVTATYAGDLANLPSTSNPVIVVIATPDYSVTASPSSATIKAGQTASTTLTVTPVGGFSGTVKFSCGTLPAAATCTFAPTTVTPSSGPATTILTVTTSAPTTAQLLPFSGRFQGIAWASLLLVTLSSQRSRRLSRRLARVGLFALLLAMGLSSLAGCSSSSPSTPVAPNPGTPTGVQTIAITTTDSGSLTHAINFQVTVQ